MKYLLLRDNKQTGPYSLEELLAKGLKAYDLVWLEGKSAAWRYPSEFNELKPYSPAVEEQPYDRFYKKPSAQTSSTEQLEARSKKEAAAEAKQESPVIDIPVPIIATTVAEEQPVVAKPVTPSKKIYVTLPAANGNGLSATNGNATKKETAQQPVAKAMVKNEEYKAYEPVPVEELAFSQLVAGKQEEKATAIVYPPRKDGRRIIMRSLVAACLILSGIVIGLAISYNMGQSHKNDLDALVKQIHEREKAREAANTQPVQPPVENTTAPVTPDSTPIDNNTAIPATDVVAVPDKAVNQVKKNNQPPTPDNKIIPASHVNKSEEDMKVTTAVLDNKEKRTYHEAAIESARKNIYTLVDVATNKYKVGVLGGISELYITLSNNSLYPLDQVSVEIKYFGPEKRVVKTQTLLFNDIASGEQKTLEVPKTNRGVSIDYSITQINSKVLGLARAK